MAYHSNLAVAGKPSAQDEKQKTGKHLFTGKNINITERMPFVGRVLELLTEEKITFSYTLDLDEDLYLKDHMFVHATNVKPAYACLPVMPMAFSLEMMAEAAACLSTGYRLIGFKNVRATQYIDLKDVDQLKLIVSAVCAGYDSKGRRLLKTSIRKEDDLTPAITATVLFGRRYMLSLVPEFDSNDVLRPFPYSADYLYRERFLFHGPLLHCIARIHARGDRTVLGDIVSSPDKQLLKSIRNPQLLTAPDLVDGMAQLVCAMFVDKTWRALPIGIERLEIYRSVPPAGISLPVFLQIKKFGKKSLSIDLEVQDEQSKVWMRAKNWRYWIMRHSSTASRYLRMPERFLLSREVNTPNLPAGTVVQALYEQDLQDVNMDLLSRTSLHQDEFAKYGALKRHPSLQRDYLLTHTVAKDAVRLWWTNQTGEDLLHPAAIQVSENSEKELIVKHPPGLREIPLRAKVINGNGRWIGLAICDDEKVDIDISRLAIGMSADDRPTGNDSEAVA